MKSPNAHYDIIKAELDKLEADVGRAKVLPLHNALAEAWTDFNEEYGDGSGFAARDGGHKPPEEPTDPNGDPRG